MPTIDRLYDDISAWQSATFPTAPATGAAKHLMEEVRDEILPLLEEGATDARLAEEWADAFFLLVDGVRRSGITHQEYILAIAAKLEKNRARKWQRPDEDGVVRHVK